LGELTMHADTKRTGQLDRRSLLKGAGLGAGAAVAGAGVAAAETMTPAKPQPKEQSGYRESESVKTYYKLARF
jgi:hypothetical protein